MLSELKPIEVRILEGRYGFHGEELTLRHLGAELNLSRERIRQIQQGALSQLRRSALCCA
jgi:DNA-directed RNA polymerase sigma subunit (sigma70/sigma32)